MGQIRDAEQRGSRPCASRHTATPVAGRLGGQPDYEHQPAHPVIRSRHAKTCSRRYLSVCDSLGER
jgi:hypothetical protein